MNEKKTVHISMDDVIEVFKDLTLHENRYRSIWENPLLNSLKELHDLYGAIFSLYVYFEDNTYSLNQTTGRFQDEFEKNADWLKFGFHAYSEQRDYCTENKELLYVDYCKTIGELKRIAGESAIDRVVRIHRFAAGSNAVERLRGVLDGLLTADDDRISYGLPNEVCWRINRCGYYIDSYGIQYIKTDIRLEWVEDHIASLVDNLILKSDRRHFEIFSHEWCWLKSEIRNKLTILCDEISENEEMVFGFYSGF